MISNIFAVENEDCDLFRKIRGVFIAHKFCPFMERTS